MSNLRPSQRPTREGPLLVLAVALVLFVCIPLYQWAASTSDEAGATFRFTPVSTAPFAGQGSAANVRLTR